MKPLVSIIMGSTSDLPVMEKACKWLNDNQIPFEVNALSAHRTPDAVESFAKGAKERGVKVIIAAACHHRRGAAFRRQAQGEAERELYRRGHADPLGHPHPPHPEHGHERHPRPLHHRAAAH